MHQMLVGEVQQGGLIPGRPGLFPTGNAVPPPAPLTCQLEDLHPIAHLREVRNVDRPRTAFLAARERFMLKRLDELLMANGLCGRHVGSLYRRKNGSANHCALESRDAYGYHSAS